MSSGIEGPHTNYASKERIGSRADQELASDSQSPWWFLSICGLFMLAGIMFLAWMGTAPVHSAIGKQLPEMRMQGLFEADDTLSYQPDSKQFTILHLWGPWSQECRQGFPAILAIAQQLKESPNFRVLSVAFPKGALNVAELRNEVQDFFQSLGDTLPTYVDLSGQTSMDLALMMPYGSLGFPTTLVVEPGGDVVFVMDGYSQEKFEQLQEFVDTKLAGD